VPAAPAAIEAAAPPPPAAAEAVAPARARGDTAAVKTETRAMMKTAADVKATELERIARLRAEGRHDEADQALEEFRKRFPDYVIPDGMRERIRRK
jgi:hypothetical protein